VVQEKSLSGIVTSKDSMETKQFFEEFKAKRPGSYYQHEQDKRLSKEMTKWGKDDKFFLAADPPAFNRCDKLNVFFWNV